MMQKRVVISITSDHIKRGRRSSRSSCPIALALTEAYHHSAFWQFTSGGFYGTRSPYFVADDTEMAKLFVTRFDSGKPVEPFDLSLTEYSTDETEPRETPRE